MRRLEDLTPEAAADLIIRYHGQLPEIDVAGKKDAPINDMLRWSFSAVGVFPGIVCLGDHGAISSPGAKRRDNLQPHLWTEFAKDYLSPQARLMLKVNQELRTDGVFGSGQAEDRSKAYGMIRKHSRTKVAEEVGTIFSEGGPLPYCYDDFVGIVQRLNESSGFGAERFLEESRITKYGERVPVCVMVAKRVSSRIEDPIIRAMMEHSLPRPSFREILYVLGDVSADSRKDDQSEIVPRAIGLMRALVLELAYGTPNGIKLTDDLWVLPSASLPRMATIYRGQDDSYWSDALSERFMTADPRGVFSLKNRKNR